MKSSQINNEKDFQRIFSKVIKHLWGWIYKIPDVGRNQKPFDNFIAYKWNIKAVELKVAPTNKTNVLRLLKDHQVSNLMSLYPNGYVACYFKKEKATSLYQMQTNWSLKEVLHLKKLLEVCGYLLWKDS